MITMVWSLTPDPPVSACQVLGLQVCSNMSVRLLICVVLYYSH